MSTPQEPLDPRELLELERLEALAADGPIEEAQRARLDALRSRCDVPHALERLHRDLASAYRELHVEAAQVRAIAPQTAQAAQDEAFLQSLQARLAERGSVAATAATASTVASGRIAASTVSSTASTSGLSSSAAASFARPQRSRRSTFVLVGAAALLGATAAGAWWWLGTRGSQGGSGEASADGAESPPPMARSESHEPEAHETPSIDSPVQRTENPTAPERILAAREAVRTAFDQVAPDAERTAFLAALDERFATLRSEGWPLDVLVTRTVERALNAAALGEAELREVEGALRWLALRHPESALPTLERAARDPRVQSAALKSLAEAGTPRALERLARRAQSEPESSAEAATALASAGLAGVERLLDLWRGEEATPESVRTALLGDAAALDRVLADRLASSRAMDRSLRELAASHGRELTRAALLARIADRGFGPQEIELAIALGGDRLVESLLDHGSREFGSPRAALIDALRRRLGFPQGAAEARAVALRFKLEDDPRATILLETLALLEPSARAASSLALLDVPSLSGVYRDHLLLALAALPPSAAEALGSELERRLAAAGPAALDHAAAWAVALAGQIDLDRALRFLASCSERERLDAALRDRLEKALLATLRAEPGLGALSALQRVQHLVQTLL